MLAQEQIRHTAELKFLAAVALRFEAPQAIGETPDGVRFDFMLQGTVDGPELKGHFPRCAAYLLIDPDGIGTIRVRAPLLFNDGAVAELEATGRYDFGADGYQRAIAKDLPNSALGWCPHFLTGDPRYMWLNRLQCLGVGELRPKETRVDYDLFAITPSLVANAVQAREPATSYRDGGVAASPWYPREPAAPALVSRLSLYERLGGKAVVDAIARDFTNAIIDNVQLNRQNPIVAGKHAAVKGEARERTIQTASQLLCKLTGGPCEFQLTRSLKESHAALNISESDWRLMWEGLERVLLKQRIGKPERDELLAIIDATKGDIVTRS